ncbi:MAG TPA: phosphodiester glycosidase family protein, partial [Nannocystis sp.]
VDGRSVVGPRARPDADARSAVAIRRDGTVLFVLLFAEQAVERAAPGRVELGARSSSTGLSLAAWADLLARPESDGGLGVDVALNLDGGYSTSASIHVGAFDLEVLAHGATINALRACAE